MTPHDLCKHTCTPCAACGKMPRLVLPGVVECSDARCALSNQVHAGNYTPAFIAWNNRQQKLKAKIREEAQELERKEAKEHV